MHGQISMFRIWSIQTDGTESCASPGLIPGLELSLVLSDTGGTTTIRDLSGPHHDGVIHDASWDPDAPPHDQTNLCANLPAAAPAAQFGTWSGGTQSSVALPSPPPPSKGVGGVGIYSMIICMVLGAVVMKVLFDKGILTPKDADGGIYGAEEMGVKEARIKELEARMEDQMVRHKTAHVCPAACLLLYLCFGRGSF